MTDFDLDAIVAAESEVNGEPHKVTWGGETFLIPRTNDWPLETFDLLGQGEFASALAGILGEQWDPFWKARHPTMGAAKALIEGISEREGFQGMGESSASSPSSNRAMRRSRPTSSATTG
jgi:hypothetical protein